jgi:hypothetical protein
MSSSHPSPAGARRGASSSAARNAAVIVASLAVGAWALVARGQLSWPPMRLLSALSTLSGCLALAGPIVFARHDRSRAGVGDLVWLNAGVLAWLYGLSAAARGTLAAERLLDPMGPVALGLAALASMIAGWRIYGPGAGWTWTNVTGWILGVFWVFGGGLALLPSSASGWMR